MRASTRPRLPSTIRWPLSAFALAMAVGTASSSGCGGRSHGPVDARGDAPPLTNTARATPVAAPPASGSAPAAPGASAASAASSTAFASLSDRVLDDLLADDPATARDLGLHAYDG